MFFLFYDINQILTKTQEHRKAVNISPKWFKIAITFFQFSNWPLVFSSPKNVTFSIFHLLLGSKFTINDIWSSNYFIPCNSTRKFHETLILSALPSLCFPPSPRQTCPVLFPLLLRATKRCFLCEHEHLFDQQVQSRCELNWYNWKDQTSFLLGSRHQLKRLLMSGQVIPSHLYRSETVSWFCMFGCLKGMKRKETTLWGSC